MRSVSIACFVGLCLSFAAMACVGGEDAEPIPAAADAPQSATEAQPTGSSASTGSAAPSTAPSAAPPEAPAAAASPDPVPVDTDAGAPPVDSDAGDGGTPPVIKVPKPKLGKLHAEANTGELCIFLVDAKAKGTAKTLDVALGVGKHTVSCERTNGTIAEEAYEIVDGQTTNVVLMFKGPVPAKL